MVPRTESVSGPEPLRVRVVAHGRAGHIAHGYERLLRPNMAMNGPDIVRKTSQAIRVEHAETHRVSGQGAEDRRLRLSLQA